MAKEIERKYLVTDNSYKTMATSRYRIIQGYISRRKEGTVRIRVRDDRAFITVKGINDGISRDEWEYEIPLADAREMLATVCDGKIIDKTRYNVPFGGLNWEIDEFHGIADPMSPSPAGDLTIAEVELPSVGSMPVLPPFIGQEVSGNPAYYNSALQ